MTLTLKKMLGDSAASRGEASPRPLRAPRAFRAWAALLAAFTDLTSHATERTRQLAEANQVLERLSLVDPLTGIANRRQFEKVLEFERRRSERTGGSLAPLMIDIDEFKVLNDAFGHLSGDESLKRVALEETSAAT